MHVIAGKYKGTKLVSPVGEVRPTTDIVKGSLFSMLESRGLLLGARCLDIFCGSGALGIEAVSRGASSCVFCDINVRNVYSNLEKLKMTARVIAGDFRRSLRQLRGDTFDLIFCDPPYESGFADSAYLLMVKYGLIDKNGVAVIEYGSKNSLIKVPEDCIIEQRTFGAASFAFIRGGYDSDSCGNV